MMRTFFLSVLLLTAVAGFQATASEAEDVDALLASEQEPAGVVFEIVGGDMDTLGELLAGVRADIKRLRARFPGLPVAVVSHGQEQFALTTGNRKNNPGAHTEALEMVTSEDVDLHVCGTHASWYDIEPGDFPDYVDVSASGPAQINDYRALGYTLIVLP